MPEPTFEEIDQKAKSLCAKEGIIWGAEDGSTLNWYRHRAREILVDHPRFVQIVITKNTEGPTYHVTWQDEHEVVRSGDFWGIGGLVIESAVRMEVPDRARSLGVVG